jgi:hypothetical protein
MAEQYDVSVSLRYCGELVITQVTKVSETDDKVTFIVTALKPGE